MPSVRSRILEMILRMHAHKRNLQKMGKFRDYLETARFVIKHAAGSRTFKVPAWLFPDIEYTLSNDKRAVLFYPSLMKSSSCDQGKDNKTSSKQERRLIIYFHGGGYFNNILTEHWHFIRRLVKATNCAVMVYDYLLSPENTYREVFVDLYRFYRPFVEGTGYFQGHESFDRIFFAGDSAGAGLALAFTMHLSSLKQRMPDRLFLFSPFLDVTCSNRDISEYEKHDLILDAQGGKAAGILYSGAYLEKTREESEKRLRHWMVSPMYGDVGRLPPVHVFGGGREIFRPDMEKFHDILISSGIRATLHIMEDMQHVYMIFAIPEGEFVIRSICDHMNDQQ